jgi:hypothetical protein
MEPGILIARLHCYLIVHDPPIDPNLNVAYIWAVVLKLKTMKPTAVLHLEDDPPRRVIHHATIVARVATGRAGVLWRRAGVLMEAHLNGLVHCTILIMPCAHHLKLREIRANFIGGSGEGGGGRS